MTNCAAATTCSLLLAAATTTTTCNVEVNVFDKSNCNNNSKQAITILVLMLICLLCNNNNKLQQHRKKMGNKTNHVSLMGKCYPSYVLRTDGQTSAHIHMYILQKNTYLKTYMHTKRKLHVCMCMSCLYIFVFFIFLCFYVCVFMQRGS